MKLIFLGPPAAGKGTQAERFSKRYEIPHIATGDMLRAQLRKGTKLGLEAKAYMDRGDLVPDSVILGMVEERIQEADCKNGYLFDGFPRTVAQAEALSEFAAIDAVVNFDVPMERIVARVGGRRACPDCGKAFHVSVYSRKECDACGGVLYQRDDDKEETIEYRLKVYAKNTAPLIAYYEQKGILHTVDGDRPVDLVTGAIAAELD